MAEQSALKIEIQNYSATEFAMGHERGAHVTALGEEVLRHYRTMSAPSERLAVSDFGSGLATLLAPTPKPSQH